MLKEDAYTIIDYAINQNKPDIALKAALSSFQFQDGRLFVIAIGKAAFLMAQQAKEVLTKKIDFGVVITKENYSLGNIDGFTIFEASHPVLTQSSITATDYVLKHTKNLKADDDVIFLLSGGGSALFEKPLCSLEYLQEITQKLLVCGADIKEINTIRKCLSQVKGGKFGKWCQPAHIHNFILSDVIANDICMIASGPTVNDTSTLDARSIGERYNLNLKQCYYDQPKVTDLSNITSTIIGSVDKLTLAAKEIAEKLGYTSTIVSSCIEMNDLVFAEKLLSLAKQHQNTNQSLAFIFGGETTVKVTGQGLGGRNQEIALATMEGLANLKDTAIFSIGSDGTDGPTDAAGGYVDSTTYLKALEAQIDIEKHLVNNDSYHALKALDSLVITGPTNTNVNDLTVILIKQ